MKFLDSTGLAYLWGKIKTALGGKGDCLDLNGQTLSLKSGENALSSVTLPGGGSSDGGEVYSTEETVIGTWIDGKALYRKVVNFSVITTNDLFGNTTAYTFPNDCIIQKLDGFATRDEEGNQCRYPLNICRYYHATGICEFFTLLFSGNRIMFYGMANGCLPQYQVTAIVDYTKTT